MTSSEYETLTLSEMQKRQWVATDRLRNGWATIPRGSRVRIIGKRGGLTVETFPCDRCGVQVSVSKVQPWKVEEVL